MLKNEIVNEIDNFGVAVLELTKHSVKIKKALNNLVALQGEAEGAESEELNEFCDMDFDALFSLFQDTLDALHSCSCNLTEIDFS